MPRTRIGGESSSPYDRSLHELRVMEARLAIDQSALERACVEQADCLYEVARTVAIQRSRRDAKKKELEEKEASLYLGVRHRASVSEERITEAEVKAEMTLDRDRRRLSTELASENDLLTRWETLRDAFSQRSYMLRELCQLYLARYYGGDVIGQAERRTMRDTATEGLRRARAERNGSN